MWKKTGTQMMEIKGFVFEATTFEHEIFGNVVKINYGINNEKSVLWKIFDPNAHSKLVPAEIIRRIAGSLVYDKKTVFLEFLSYNSDNGYFNAIVRN